MGLAFLNYRRDDVGAAAQAIYAQMKVHFGSGQLFMDLNSIEAGAEWPAHLRQRVEKRHRHACADRGELVASDRSVGTQAHRPR